MNPTKGANIFTQEVYGRGFGAFFKYDGVEVRPCGSPQPEFLFPGISPIGGTEKFIRVIEHTLDFDQNEPVSEHIQFGLSGIENAVQITNSALFSSVLDQSMFYFGLDFSPKDHYISGFIWKEETQPYTAIPLMIYPAFNGVESSTSLSNTEFEVVVKAENTNFHLCKPEGYVFVRWAYEAYSTVVIGGISREVLGIAMNIKSCVLDPITDEYTMVLDKPKGYTTDRSWSDVDSLFIAINQGTKACFTVWSSNAATGNYVFKGIYPRFPGVVGSTTPITVNITSATTADLTNIQNIFTVSPNLGDWYDVNVRKLCLNTYPINNLNQTMSENRLRGVTGYKGMLVMYTDNLIYYSDTTLGGSFEQTTFSSNFLQGSAYDGEVISCCGSNEVLLVSRERNSWVLNGNLPTGSVRVQEVTGMELGAWSNSSAISIQNFLFVITSSGVFMISESGSAKDISVRVPMNFDRHNPFPNTEDVSFVLEGTNGLYYSGDKGLSVAYDENRGFLAFCKKGVNSPKNPMLVLDVGTGEFYEWDSVAPSGKFVSAIFFEEGKLIAAYSEVVEDKATAANISVETNSGRLNGQESPIKLYSTWMTAENPSLEKNALQLKFFGNVYNQDKDNTISVVSFNDWDNTEKITNEGYIPLPTNTYSHKKRLNSSKPLATSVGFEVNNTSSFRIEGLEVEFNIIQAGMKR